MQKKLIRMYKSNYGYRWTILKNNLKPSNEPLVTLQDYLIFKNLIPGTTLGLDFMCNQYISTIDNLTVVEWPIEQPTTVYNNIILLNNRFLKYKSFDEMKEFLLDVTQFLQPNGRLFVSFNFQFVKYNRLTKNFLQEINQWVNALDLSDIKLVKKIISNVPKTDPYGDCLFVFELDN